MKETIFSVNNPKYDIPTNCSNILFHYLQNQKTSDLQRLKEQYEAELKRNPGNKDVTELYGIIENIIQNRKG